MKREKKVALRHSISMLLAIDCFPLGSSNFYRGDKVNKKSCSWKVRWYWEIKKSYWSLSFYSKVFNFYFHFHRRYDSQLIFDIGNFLKDKEDIEISVILTYIEKYLSFTISTIPKAKEDKYIILLNKN